MEVLVETSIWYLALRRNKQNAIKIHLLASFRNSLTRLVSEL